MVFDFLTPENQNGSMTIPESGSDKVPFFQIPEQRQNDFKNEINELNKLFHKHDVNVSFILNPYIDFVDYAYACMVPKTNTGRQPKYSHYAYFGMHTKNHEEQVMNNSFGDIYFYPSGKPGKARVVFWRNHKCFAAHFRSTKSEKLYLWRVTTRRRTDSRDIVLFENTEV